MAQKAETYAAGFGNIDRNARPRVNVILCDNNVLLRETSDGECHLE